MVGYEEGLGVTWGDYAPARRSEGQRNLAALTCLAAVSRAESKRRSRRSAEAGRPAPAGRAVLPLLADVDSLLADCCSQAMVDDGAWAIAGDADAGFARGEGDAGADRATGSWKTIANFCSTDGADQPSPPM